MKCKKINIKVILFFFITAFPAFAVSNGINALDSLGIPVLISPLNNAIYQASQNLMFSWLPLTNADSYEIQYSIDSSFTQDGAVFDVSTKTTQVYVINLIENTVYYWRIRGAEGILNGNWSDVWKFTTTIPPEAINSYFPLNNVRNQKIVTFVWGKGAPQNAYYLFQASPDSTFSNQNTLVEQESADTSITINYLEYGTTYYWRVSAENADRIKSDWSELKIIRTMLSPAQIKQPAGNGADTNAVFFWNPVPSAQFYHLQISSQKNFQDSSIIFNGILDTNSANINPFKMNSSWYWRILAYNSGGDSSSWSDTVFFRTKFASTNLVLPIDHFRNADTVISLSWDSLSTAVKYRISLSNDSTFTIAGIDSITTSNQIIAKGLQHIITYYWRAFGIDAENNIGYWSTVRRFTTALPAPVILSNFTGLINRTTFLPVTWAKSDSAKRYQFQLALDSLFTDSLKNFYVNNNYLVLASLVPDTTYYFRVKALDNLGDSSNWSKINSFLTAPAFLVQTKIIADTINLSVNPTDSIETITFTNNGPNPIIYDSVYTIPDSVFLIDSNQLIIPSHSIINFQIKISQTKAQLGNNYGILYFTKKNILPQEIVRDTLKVFIKKAVAALVSDSVYFSIASPDTASYKTFHIFNLNGNIPLLINKVTLAGTNPSAFVLLSHSDTVYQQGSGYFSFYFKPVEIGMNEARLLLETNSFPTKIFQYYLFGTGRGGRLSPWTVSRIQSFSDTIFESQTNNDKLITISNNGNESLFIWPIFSKNNFTLIADKIQENLPILPGDSISAKLRYLTPNFNKVNIDTMKIYTNGFGLNPIVVALKGGFDSTLSVLIQTKILADTINLSEKPSDSIAVVTIFNRGPNPIVYDSVYTTPDSIFLPDKNNLSIPAYSSGIIHLKISPIKTIAGSNHGLIYLARKDIIGREEIDKDTVKVFIKKAIALILSDSIYFPSASPDTISAKGFNIFNLEGNIPLLIEKVTLAGKDSAAFNLYFHSDTVFQQNSGFFFVNFKPLEIGMNDARLVLETNSFPTKIFQYYLFGAGRGGRLSPWTVSRIQSFSDTIFESQTNNDKLITINNNGNESLFIWPNFSKNNFTLIADKIQKNLPILPGDSIIAKLSYLTKNFNKLNTDTMKIFSNGLGQNPITVFLRGGFDSALSVSKILNSAKIDSINYYQALTKYREDSVISIIVDPKAVASMSYPDFKFYYFKGGDSVCSNFYNGDSLFSYYIDPVFVTNKGLNISGELLSRGSHAEILDSVFLFKNFSPQISLSNYGFTSRNVPLSVPAQTAGQSNIKWMLFGFPFSPVYFDSVFHYFGGRNNMKDGEWIVYKYDPGAVGSFSVFNDEQFEPASAYFFAQALVDTFKISNLYYGRTLTRKLTDTVMTFSSNSWKTVSDPYTFNVQVEPPVILYKYDTDNKTYLMTNIMKPGEGYFLEPSFNTVYLKTFGPYQQLTIPKIINDARWYLKLNISGNKAVSNLLFSILNSSQLPKLNNNLSVNNYEIPPRIQKGLYSYIQGISEDAKYCVSVADNNDGAAWDVIISNDLQDDKVIVNTFLNGGIPSNYSLVIYDVLAKRIINNTPYSINIAKDGKYPLKIIIGTKDFIKNTIEQAGEQFPAEFALLQNYPNPFNPSTTIKYAIPYLDGNPVRVQLKIYDILGNEISTLVDENKLPGYYDVKFDGNKYASGVYFSRIKAGSFVAVKKMLLLK